MVVPSDDDRSRNLTTSDNILTTDSFIYMTLAEFRRQTPINYGQKSIELAWRSRNELFFPSYTIHCNKSNELLRMKATLEVSNYSLQVARAISHASRAPRETTN